MGWNSGMKRSLTVIPASLAYDFPLWVQSLGMGSMRKRDRHRGSSFFMGSMYAILSVILEIAVISNLFVQWNVGATDSEEPVGGGISSWDTVDASSGLPFSP